MKGLYGKTFYELMKTFSMPHSVAFTPVRKAPLITCNLHDPMHFMGGISSFPLCSFIFFKTSQFVFGPSICNRVTLSIVGEEGNPFKSSSNKVFAVVLYWSCDPRSLSWKHYSSKTKISPEGPFVPSPEHSYVSHQTTH